MRVLVALLALANLGFFALAQGWALPYVGLSRHHEREPQRLAAQINADAVRVLPAEVATAAAAAAAASAASAAASAGD